jgi:hypothetical protein
MSTASTKDLSRAVAFLTLERVQQTSDEAKTAFLAGKGFTNDEIVEAKRQAEELLQKKRSTGSTSNSGHQTFGGAAAASSTTTIAHVVTVPGAKASTRVTLGGGGITFVSLASGPDDGITTPQAQVKLLLVRLESTLASTSSPAGAGAGAAAASTPSARSKADVAVIYLSVQGLEKYEDEIHETLDGWVDAQAPPTRFVIEQTGKRNMAQLMAVVRG